MPISALVASASLQDNLVTILLIKLTSRKVVYLYDLMDAAYSVKRIDETSRKFRHVPITDRNEGGKEAAPGS